MELPVTILLPLYVYPADDPDAWAAVAAQPVRTSPSSSTSTMDRARGTTRRTGTPPPRWPTPACRCSATSTSTTRKRPLPDVQADIAAWRAYPVGGVFFDQVPSGPRALGWMTVAAATVRGRIVLNPGTRPHPGYAALADLVCTYEGPWPRYRATPGRAGLAQRRPPGLRRAARPTCTEATRRLYRRVAHGLVTDLAGTNPYRGLPAPLRMPAQGGRVSGRIGRRAGYWRSAARRSRLVLAAGHRRWWSPSRAVRARGTRPTAARHSSGGPAQPGDSAARVGRRLVAPARRADLAVAALRDAGPRRRRAGVRHRRGRVVAPPTSPRCTPPAAR